MAKTVSWSFITSSHNWNVDHPDCIKPLIPTDYNPFTNLSKYITSSRKRTTYLKCPAHTDFLKNTFVFCAPFDLNIDLTVDPKSNSARVFCDNITQEIYQYIVDTRFILDTARNKVKYPLLGIDWLIVLQSTEPCLVQLLPAFMHQNDFTEKTTIIPGEYDISKWTRPIETAFEIRSNQERIEIKKGDALAYIKFHSEDTIKLIKAATPWDEIILCNTIRTADTFRPLKERYQSLEKERANRCPVDHNKKGP
jgi:hypothetical protein